MLLKGLADCGLRQRHAPLAAHGILFGPKLKSPACHVRDLSLHRITSTFTQRGRLAAARARRLTPCRSSFNEEGAEQKQQQQLQQQEQQLGSTPPLMVAVNTWCYWMLGLLFLADLSTLGEPLKVALWHWLWGSTPWSSTLWTWVGRI